MKIWLPKSFIAIDFETTPDRSEPTQLGVAKVIDGQIQSIHEFILRPKKPFAGKAMSGQTWAELEPLGEENFFPKTWGQVKPLLSGSLYLTSYTLFDLRVYLDACVAWGLIPHSIPWHCAMAKTKERLDLRRNIPLVEACRLFGIDHKANHSAGPDAEACAKLMIEVIK